MKHSGKREAVIDYLGTVDDSTYDGILAYLLDIGFVVSAKTQRSDLIAMAKEGLIDVVGKRKVGKMLSNVYALPAAKPWIMSAPFSYSSNWTGAFPLAN